MKVSRWNNRRGSSAGVWLVDDIPGLVVFQQYFYRYWKFAFSPHAEGRESAAGNPRLGAGIPSRCFLGAERSQFSTAAWVLSHPKTNKQFKSRSEALLALEGLLNSRSHLQDILQAD